MTVLTTDFDMVLRSLNLRGRLFNCFRAAKSAFSDANTCPDSVFSISFITDGSRPIFLTLAMPASSIANTLVPNFTTRVASRPSSIMSRIDDSLMTYRFPRIPVSEVIEVKLNTKVIKTGMTKNMVTAIDAGIMNQTGRSERLKRICLFYYLCLAWINRLVLTSLDIHTSAPPVRQHTHRTGLMLRSANIIVVLADDHLVSHRRFYLFDHGIDRFLRAKVATPGRGQALPDERIVLSKIDIVG